MQLKDGHRLFTLLLLIFAFASCTPEEEEMEPTLTIPNTYVFSEVSIFAQTYRVTQDGGYEPISSDTYNMNTQGFGGFLFDDILDSMRVSLRPASTIDFVSDDKVDIYGWKLLGPSSDILGLDYTTMGAKIIVDHDFETDRFILHMELELFNELRINFAATQVHTNGNTLPIIIDQIEGTDTLEEAAQAVMKSNDLVAGDYFYVIFGVYSYLRDF